MRYLQAISYALIIIGALNWGLIGLFNYDLVASLFGNMGLVSRTIYTLVGLSAIINVVLEFTVCRNYTRCYAHPSA
ncbi:MAG: DUF378 domain-containing protein [bacterium]